MVRPATEAVRHKLTKFLSVRSSYNPTFSTDDRKLVYISDATGVPQVWSLALEEGSPQQLTYFEDRVGGVSSAKKSDSFLLEKDHGGNERFQLFLATDGGDSLEALTDEPDVIHSFGGWSPQEDAILFSSNKRDRAFFDVYTMDLGTRKQSLVYRGDQTNYGIDWSPRRGDKLMQRMYGSFNYDLFLVGKDSRPRLLTKHKGDVVSASAQFSADGRQVYLITDLGREFTAPAVMDLEDPKPHYLFEDEWDAEGLELSDDGKKLAFTTNVDGASRLAIWEFSGPKLGVKMPSGVIGGMKWSHDGGALAFTFSDANHNQDIWIHDLSKGSTTRVTNSSSSGLDLAKCAKPKLGRFSSFDGLSVPYYLYSAKDGGGPRPSVVYIHGGPESQYRPSFNPLVQFLVSMGLSVVAPNVRGSSGYGRAYTHLDDVTLRMDSVADIDSLVARLKKDGMIDAKRTGVIGGSYGGFMVLACMYRYPKVWAAGVDIVGISNFVTFLKNTGPWRRKLRAVEYGDPARDKDFLESIAPLNNASKITAPLFMIHGTNDPRVPFGETKQIEAELKGLGRRVDVMMFDDEGHGLVKLRNRIKGYTAAAEFLLEHLQN